MNVHPTKQFQNLLELDEEQIKSLELSALKQMVPIYEHKFNEVSKQLEVLQNENKKQKQKLIFLEVQKFELEALTEKLKKIDMELAERESKALQELEKAKVMCPIYEYKMNHFLKQYDSAVELKEYKQPLNWNQRYNELIELKQKLQKTIDVNEQVTEDFVKKYLT